MKIIALYVVAFAILLIPSAANAEPQDGRPDVKSFTKEKGVKKHAVSPLNLPDIAALTKALWQADMKILPKQRWKSATVLAFFNGKGKWLRATRFEKCWEVPWQRSCTVARASYRLHSALAAVATRRLMYEIPITQNWTRAMRLAQRAFPGTYDWLESISNRECRACYTTTAFVCNYQGSGACGPMQFMSGTFHSYAFGIGYGAGPGAKAWLAARGFIVPAAAWRWQSQLGQALTAAYMKYTGRSGCHWCL